MSQEHTEPAIIRSLYQSVFKADDWGVALGQLCQYCGAEAAELMVTETTLMRFSVAVGTPLSMHQGGEVMIYCIPVIQEPELEPAHMPGSYNWFHVKTAGVNTGKWLEVLMAELGEQIRKIDDTPYLAWLILQKPSNTSGDFSWVSSGLINLLHCHLKMAVLLFEKNNQQRVRHKFEMEILNKLNIAIACITNSGLVAYRNKAFDSLITAEDGLYLVDNRLSTQPDTLCPLFTDIARTAIENHLGGIRIIDRPSDKPGYQVIYLPSNHSMKDLTGSTVYLSFIFDPCNGSEQLVEWVEHGYELSRIESKLVTHICRGVTVEEYAEQENVSVATVRTQLRSIYKRTGVKGQVKLSHLVRRLDLLSPPDKLEKKSRKKYKRKSRTFDLAAFMASVGVPRRDQD